MNPSPKPLHNWPLDALPGLPAVLREQLQQLGILTTGDLVRRGQSADERLRLAQQLNSHPQHVNKWTALARLAMLPSVGPTYCGLLLHAGISSPEQLALAHVQRLHQQLQRLHIKLLTQVKGCPGPALVQQWIQEAQQWNMQRRQGNLGVNRDTKTSP